MIILQDNSLYPDLKSSLAKTTPISNDEAQDSPRTNLDLGKRRHTEFDDQHPTNKIKRCLFFWAGKNLMQIPPVMSLAPDNPSIKHELSDLLTTAERDALALEHEPHFHHYT